MVLAIALGASGCASGLGQYQFKGTTAASFERTIKESRDPNLRYAAYDSLGSAKCYDNEEQKAEAAHLMAEKLKAGKEPNATRAVICRSLGMIRRPEAREAVLVAINDDDPLVRAEACRALGRVGRPEDATVLARTMGLDSSGECKVAAIESLGELKPKDPRIAEYLVIGMEHDEPAIRVACLKSLRAITGQDRGVDAIAWKKYVETLSPPAKPRTGPIDMPQVATGDKTTDDLPPLPDDILPR